MLPEALSNDACSLRPGVDRLAVTVELELRGAETVKAAFHRSLIRSDERLDYDRVDRIFAGAERAADPWAGPLAAARAAAAALQGRREARGALAIESVEPEFAFDRRGHVLEARPSEHSESHRLIEHLMIAANEAVATLLSERSVPRCTASTSARSRRPCCGSSTSSPRSTSPPRRCPSRSRPRRRPRSSRSARSSSTSTCAAPATAAARSPRWSCARSSRPTTRP